MSVPGSGLLAALRRKNKQPEAEISQPDESRFAVRSSAVQAMEHAVAVGSTPEPAKRPAARGCVISPSEGDFLYHLDEAHPGEERPELTYAPVTRVPAEYKEAHMRQIAVSEEYITYGLKQGHIRALHRFSEARALLKGHTGPIADIRFIRNDLVAAGGQDGQLFVWRLQVVDGDNALHVAQLLHATFSPGCYAQVLLASAEGEAGNLVVGVGNAVLALAVPKDSAQVLEIDPSSPASAQKMPNFPPADKPTAVAVSPDGKLVAAGSGSGRVCVCKLEGGSLVELSAGNSIPSEATAISGLEWGAAGDDGYTLLMCSADGAQQTLYSYTAGATAFVRGGSVRLQAGDAQGVAPFIHTGVVRQQRLVVLADTRRKAVYTLHWSGAGSAIAFDYLSRFGVGLPILNFAPMWNPDVGDEGAVELNCVQTEAVQQYFLDPQLCFDERAAAVADGAPAEPAEPALPLPVEAELPQPSPHLANGKGVESVTGGNRKAEKHAAVAVAPAPAKKAERAPEAAAAAAPSAPMPPAPAPLQLPSPTPAPKLLTPKDLLRASAAAAASKLPAPLPERASTSPAPGSQPQPSVKILQRSAPKPEEPKLAPAAAPPAELEIAPPTASAALSTDAGTVAAALAEEMSGVHRKFAGHVSSMYRELLKAMKAEIVAQAAEQQAATAALVREALAQQAAAAQAERAAVLAEERAGTERLLSAISAALNRDLPARLQEALHAELAAVGDAVAGSVVPVVQAAVQVSLPKDVAAAVKAALDKQLPGALQSGLAKPLGESFRKAFEKQLIPAFEGAVQTMFQQVNTALTQGLEEHLQASRAALEEPAGLAASLRDSLGAAQAMAETLRHGQEGLLLSASLSTATSGARSPAAPAAVDVRGELRTLAAAGHYEEAFSRALGLQDVSTVAWLCSQADAAAVVSRDPPALSQMVLLSLVQQLASDLATGAATKLQWIREAAMVLNPQDPQLAPHLRPVLEQVTGALQAAARQLKGADASSCKLAMHVVHSQMTS